MCSSTLGKDLAAAPVRLGRALGRSLVASDRLELDGLDGGEPLVQPDLRGGFLSRELHCGLRRRRVGCHEGGGLDARLDRVFGRDSDDGAGDGDGAGDTGRNADVHRALRRDGDARHG